MSSRPRLSTINRFRAGGLIALFIIATYITLTLFMFDLRSAWILCPYVLALIGWAIWLYYIGSCYKAARRFEGSDDNWGYEPSDDGAVHVSDQEWARITTVINYRRTRNPADRALEDRDRMIIWVSRTRHGFDYFWTATGYGLLALAVLVVQIAWALVQSHPDMIQKMSLLPLQQHYWGTHLIITSLYALIAWGSYVASWDWRYHYVVYSGTVGTRVSAPPWFLLGVIDEELENIDLWRITQVGARVSWLAKFFRLNMGTVQIESESNEDKNYNEQPRCPFPIEQRKRIEDGRLAAQREIQSPATIPSAIRRPRGRSESAPYRSDDTQPIMEAE